MAEYIEREKALKLLGDAASVLTGDERTIMESACDIIEDAPAADVRPERHGFWKECTNGNAWWYECSECNHIPNLEGKSPFCLRCGAKMDGKDGKDSENSSNNT